ncbi:hypothetical protein [Mycobacterium sp.]|uniref:hypothetical protein n=1 Tax=Mycobacterium sp. TaxID=1785 RepID=UPI0031D404AE
MGRSENKVAIVTGSGAGMKLDFLLTVDPGYYQRFTAIAPGPKDTEANRTTTPQEIVQDVVKGLPLSRMGTPDEASWITGQVIRS